jgi:ABC-2 type transport system permease protein
MSTLTGTRALVRLALRRDRVLLPVWIAVLAGVASSSASATAGLYPTEASRAQAAASINGTPSLVALYGRVYDETSLGAVSMLKLTAIGAVLVAILSIMTVVRHTRAEEETGRLELLGATVVGRHAPLAAALIVAVGMNVVLGLLTAAGLMASGLPSDGAVAFGLAWGTVGIAFAAVAAASAQLTESARTANGIAIAVLGGAYVLRAIGDSAGDGGARSLSWFSPIGWGQQVRAFAGDRWSVLLLPAGFALVLAALAYVLAARRDLGAGLVAARAGHAEASASLRSPLALAWRLHRGTLFAWTAGFLVLGAALGNIAANVGNFFGSPQAREMLMKLGGEKGLTDAFLATELGFVGVIVSAFGVQAAMRLRAEETAQRAEPVLATAVSRTRWALSHVTIAAGGAAFLLVVGGLAAGTSHAAQTGDAAQVGRVLAGALVQLPAVLVLTGIVVAAFGLAPRWTLAGWAALVGFLLLGEVGPLLRLKQWMMDLSPYAHVPRLPGSHVTAAPLVALLSIAVALMVAGLVGFRRRDVTS